jgi:hypothetical protein
LPEEDEEYLNARSLDWETVIDGQAKWLILHGYPIPPGYNHGNSDLALRIKPSYPDDDIDMAYFCPHLANGKPIPNLSLSNIDGRNYQQWSRHRKGANPWRPGVDCVATHLLQVDEWLKKETTR